MNIDYTPITSSARYNNDKDKLLMKPQMRTLQILLIIAMAMFPPLWPVLALYAFTYYQNNKHKTQERMSILQSFADTHSFTFTQHHKGFISKVGAPISLDLPYLYKTNSPWFEMRGTMGNYPFVYTLVSLMSDHNEKHDSKASNGSFNVLAIELPVSLPRIFIDSKSNNLGILNGKALNFEQAEDHSLEGDFHQYFNVRIEKNEHIDMYTILTPEVMDALKQHNFYDVWLNGTTLSLITFGDEERYFAGLPSSFETAELIMQEIDKIARATRANNT